MFGLNVKLDFSSVEELLFLHLAVVSFVVFVVCLFLLFFARVACGVVCESERHAHKYVEVSVSLFFLADVISLMILLILYNFF